MAENEDDKIIKNQAILIDFRDIEMRLGMYATYDQLVKDPHAARAAEIFRVKITDVTAAQRKFAKLEYFKRMYGGK